MNRNHSTRTLRTIKNSHTKINNNNKNKPVVAKTPASKLPASKLPASKLPASKLQTNNKPGNSGQSGPSEVRRTSQLHNSPNEVRLGSPVTSNNIRAKLSEPVEDLLVFDESDDGDDSYGNPVENSPRKPAKIVEVPRKVRVIGQTSGARRAANANTNVSASPSPSPNARPSPVLDKQAMEAIYAQSIDLIYECDPDQNCSKDELIERLERKRDRLPEDHSDRIAFNHLLKELIAEEREQKITNMNQTRSQQDLIVKKIKLKPEHFKGKTNLTPSDEEYKELGEDEQLKIFKTSKKYFEKVREYKALPKNLADPFSKGKLRGNRKPPPELFNSIAAKFA